VFIAAIAIQKQAALTLTRNTIVRIRFTRFFPSLIPGLAWVAQKIEAERERSSLERYISCNVSMGKDVLRRSGDGVAKVVCATTHTLTLAGALILR
jgi:hypothetical protein